jgi:hypothetical protein
MLLSLHPEFRVVLLERIGKKKFLLGLSEVQLYFSQEGSFLTSPFLLAGSSTLWACGIFNICFFGCYKPSKHNETNSPYPYFLASPRKENRFIPF